MSALRRYRKQESGTTRHWCVVVAAFVGGMVMGIILPSMTSSSSRHSQSVPTSGKVTSLLQTPFRNTSHVDALTGRPIVKQQLLDAFVLPNFVGFSVATFEPGQSMSPPHDHVNLHEFFYVLEGSGIIQVNSIHHKVSAGSFVYVTPREAHAVSVPETNSQPMKMAVFGVTV